MVEFVIFVIKLILIQTTHILQHLTDIYQNTQYFIRTSTNITIFDTLDRIVPQQDLRISREIVIAQLLYDF